MKLAYVEYDFEGSLSVGKVMLKSGKSFGRTVKNRLIFEFPVFLRFSPSANVTSETGGTANMQYYRGELVPGAKGKLKCKLTKVNEQEAKYGGDFTMRDIGLATPQGRMKDAYSLNLEPKEANDGGSKK